jgi:hypothetical protein
MDREYVECNCSCSEHTLRFAWFRNEKDPALYVDVFLHQYYGFWKRLWLGIKYICGHKSKYGHFDEALLFRAEVENLRDVCNKFLDANPKLPIEPLQRISILKMMKEHTEEELSQARKELAQVEHHDV